MRFKHQNWTLLHPHTYLENWKWPI